VGININNEIYAAQIRAVYQQTPMVLIVNVVNSALVALILGSYAEHTGWWIFFGLVLTMTGVRAIVWGSITIIRNHTGPQRSGHNSQHWDQDCLGCSGA
jgi:predicted signal transduction protein with EAL and GGDEF domain